MASEDGEWKPNGRPTSTIARNFSASLNDAFAIDSSLEGLAQSVEQKKQALTSQNQELQALEARLRDTEERLRQRQSRTASPAAGTESPHRRKPIGNTFSGQENDRLHTSSTSSPLATHSSPSQTVSGSTMSHWRPAPQDTSQSPGRASANAPPARSNR